MEDPLARIHREFVAQCVAEGRDVAANRAAVLERIENKLADPTVPLFKPPEEPWRPKRAGRRRRS